MSPLWKNGDMWLNATQVAKLLSVSRNSLKSLMRRFIDPLPQPFPFGQNGRWLASDVWAWMERQMSRGNAEPPSDVASDSATEPRESAQSRSPVNDADLWVDQLKTEYELGTTLDELCRQHKVGKARLSELLRNAGVSMRKPGRRGVPAMETEARAVVQGDRHAH